MPKYGVSGPGRLGVDRRQTRARSIPTGWETRKGEVYGQELEFENGYLVLAVSVPNQKATIKGPEAWGEWIAHIEQIKEAVAEWLAANKREHNGGQEQTAHMGSQKTEERLDRLERNINQLITALSVGRKEELVK